MAEEAVEYVCVCVIHTEFLNLVGNLLLAKVQLGTNLNIIYLMLESDKGHKTKYISGIEHFHVYEINE